MTPAKILMLDPDAAAAGLLQKLMPDQEVLAGTSQEEALKHLRSQKIAVLICDFDWPAMPAQELLQRAKIEAPKTKRVLVAPYSEVAELIKGHADELADRIHPKPCKPGTLQKSIAELILDFEHSAVLKMDPDARSLKWADGQALLRWSAAKISHVHGRVLRRLPEKESMLQLQFVCAQGEEYEKLLQEVRLRWGQPLKERGKSQSWSTRKHPVARYYGGLQKSQCAFAKSFGEGAGEFFLAVLPWRKEPKVTLVLGMLCPQFDASYRQCIENIYELSIGYLSQIQLSVERHGPDAQLGSQYLASHDLVASDNYVGPERRRRPTGTLDEYTFRGKRRIVPVNIQAVAQTFVDRLTPFALKCFTAYFLLSCIDTLFTYYFVRNGTVRELNPILRPLLHDFPWAFFLVKNAIAIVAFLIVSRFELFHLLGKGLLYLVISGYIVLDCYWLYLLWP